MEKILFSSKPKEGESWDVVIIGSGPAGLTSAIYTTRSALSTLIIGGSVWGGQLMLTTVVDNFPGFPEGISGPDLMEKMREQAERFGAEFIQADTQKVNLTKMPFEIEAEGKIYKARSVIIATGAETIWLDVPGIREFIGRGVSSCAPCDAPFFKNKKVAVVGGGDTAMEEAYTLTKYAQEVVIIHRRDAFRASEAMQKKIIDNPKVKILWNSEVKEIKGTDKLEKLVLKNNKTNEISELPIDGVFIAIGHKPQSTIFGDQIEVDERGFIKIAGKHSKTSKEGIFVAGDVMDPYYKQAITAAASGCIAAMEVVAYLEKNN